MNIVILDNFDSFTFNLLDEFRAPDHHLHVWRNSMKANEAEERLLMLNGKKLLVLSPGPGHPDDAGCMNELIKRMTNKIPIFGVCLGMQAMVSINGGKVTRAPQIVHGKARILEHEGELIFKGLSNRIHVGRYHSLSASVIPKNFRIFGHSNDLVMAISQNDSPVIGIQFHPESILTTQGSRMIKNVIAWAKEHS
jgi:anthranilate synthase/aminodeoxychorismate synthase-like glutamine amidotransferase